MGAGRQGSGRRPLPVAVLNLDQRGTRCGEKSLPTRFGRKGFLRRQDRVRGRARTADRVRASGSAPNWRRPVSSPRQGCSDEFPELRQHFRPGEPVCCRAPTSPPRPPRACVSEAGRSRTSPPYASVRVAPPAAETRESDQDDRRLLTRVCFTSSSTVRNLVGIAGKPHACTIVAVHRSRRPLRLASRVSACGWTCSRRPPRWVHWSTRWPSMRPGCAPSALLPPRRRAGAGNGGSARMAVFLGSGPARLRRTPAMRRLVAQTSLEPRHLVLPMFVADGIDGTRTHRLDALGGAAQPATRW